MDSFGKSVDSLRKRANSSRNPLVSFMGSVGCLRRTMETNGMIEEINRLLSEIMKFLTKIWVSVGWGTGVATECPAVSRKATPPPSQGINESLE